METKILSTAQPEKYREMSNYREAIQIIENSSEIDLKETKGVAEYCVLNNLEYFNILENWTGDIMHDLCEGTIKVLLEQFFGFGIKNKVFTESEVKNLVLNYDFGILNGRFIPSNIKFTTKNLNQNASQMKCLFQHIPFIFFSYKNNEKLEKCWDCINSMLKILRICYSNTILEQNLAELELAVQSHLENVQACFRIPLKPKHHFMTHYAEIIRRSGPLCHMSTLRFEMKHKTLTSTMKNNNNFKNVTKFMTEKLQHKNVFQEVYTDQIKCAKLRKIDQNLIRKYENILNIYDNPSAIQSTKNFRFNSDFYERRLILKHDLDYLEIENILYIDESFYFVCTKYERVRFDEFLISLEIKPSLSNEYLLLKHSELIYTKSHDKKIIGDQIFILCDSLEIY